MHSYVYIRNSYYFSGIVCPIDNDPSNNFTKINMLSYNVSNGNLAELKDIKKTSTDKFIKFAKEHNITGIRILVRGPISVNNVLDLEKLTLNGIAIDYIRDQNIKVSNSNTVKLIRQKLQI